MVTLVVATRPQIAAPYLKRINGPVYCVIPAGTEDLWHELEVPLLPVTSWTDYSQLAERVAELPTVAQVIGTDEITIAPAGFLRSLLGAPGQELSQAVAFTDKAVMKRRLHDAGVPVARFAVVHSFDEIAVVAAEFGWPVVVKPRRGFGTLGTTRISSAENLRELTAAGRFATRASGRDLVDTLRAAGVYDSVDSSPDGFLVEQCIDVIAEFTCDIVVWKDGSRLTFVTQHVMPLLDAVEGGHAAEQLTLTADDPTADTVAALTIRALDVLGHPASPVHCEVFRTRAGDYVLGEIACRAGGAALPVLSEILFGINTIAAGVDLALHREPPRPSARRHRMVATVAIVPSHGTVLRLPAKSELEALPDVLRAEVRVREGDCYGGGLGSAGAAAYLYIEPDPRQVLDIQMAAIRARVEPMFVVEPEPMMSLR